MKIYQRKDGKWVVDFTLKKKRIRRIIEGTKRMAQQAAILEKERIYRQKYGIPESKKKVRFEEYAKIYEENYSKDKRAYKNESYIIKRLRSYFKDKFLNEITPGEIDGFKQKRKKDGVCNATINRNLALLKAIFNKAIDSEDYGIERNPVNKVEFLDEDSRRERILTLDEMEGLIKKAHTSWRGQLPLFLVIALNTGMRKSEILSLRWKDVNFKKKYLEVIKERAKNKKMRKVPMNEVVAEELKKIKRENEYIFFNPNTGSHIKHIKTTFKRACREAGIKNITVHDLRHTAASFLVNDCGVDVVTASQILGHSKLEMTMKYIHPSDEHKQRGVDRLGEIFNKARHKVDMTASVDQVEKSPSPHIYYH